MPLAHLPNAVDALEIDAGSVLHHYRAMLLLRSEHEALRVGTIELRDDLPDDVLGFVRRQGDVRMLCLFNFSQDHAARCPLADDERLVDLRAAGFGTVAGEVVLEPLGWVIGTLPA